MGIRIVSVKVLNRYRVFIEKERDKYEVRY